jgi:ABC-type multidrug transport system fused ATPase/permease subunit
VLRHYARVAGVTPVHVIVPIALVLIAGAFEAASFSLLIPLTNAVSGDSFDFLADSPGFGWLAGLVPDSITDPTLRDSFLVLVTVGLIIAGRVGKLVFEYVRKLYLVARTERYRVAVGEETFGRVLRFGRQYFDGHSIGRIDAEIGWSSSVLGLLTSAEELFRYLIGLVAKAVPMVVMAPALAIAFLVTLPFVQWFMNSINTRVRHIAAEGIEVDRRVRSRILDILGSIPLVKAYSQEKTASDAYAEVLEEARDVAVRRYGTPSKKWPSSWSCSPSRARWSTWPATSPRATSRRSERSW